MTIGVTLEGGVAVVTVDNPPVNALGHAVRSGLWHAAEALDADPAVRAVVLICAGRTFIAGADVREFDRPPEPPFLPDLVARIEGAAKPWVAAIHGSALGGGFELAMGCRFRVAVAGASVGLPEVTLGLVPGAGGTVRSTRLAGAALAVDLVTTGRAIPAPEAVAAGLVDAIAPGDLRAFAIDFAQKAVSAPLPPPATARVQPTVPAGFWAAQAAAISARGRGAAAPLRALDCVRQAVERDIAEALAHERATFLELRNSAEAAALRRIFFAERAAQRGPAEVEGIRRDVRAVMVVGPAEGRAGDIASALRAAGLAVVAADLAEVSAAAVGAADLVLLVPDPEREGDALAMARGLIADHPDAAVGVVTGGRDPAPPLADAGEPAGVIGLHFPEPVDATGLIEILPLATTAPPVIAAALSLARRAGRVAFCHPRGGAPISPRLRTRLAAEVEAAEARGVAPARLSAALAAYGFDPRVLAASGLPEVSADASADLAVAAAVVAGLAAEAHRLCLEDAGFGAVEIDLAAVHATGFPRWRGGPMFATGS
jgi:3-hydroxyacyl-CoA dehydrogenase